jgi:DinB superfamily
MNETFSYPIGKMTARAEYSDQDRNIFLIQLEELPNNLRAAVAGLNESNLETPYRDGGWTLRQVVHHVPDSHLQGYMRFKLALTEDNPTVTAYHQPAWGELEDVQTAPLEVSIRLLEALHVRWVNVIRGMKPEDFARTFVIKGETRSLDMTLHLYAWHSLHHVAQINGLRMRKGWL